MAESSSDDHIAAVYFAHACELNSIPYEDLDIDRYRAELLFQSRFQDGYSDYYRHVQAVDRGFRARAPPFERAQVQYYRARAGWQPHDAMAQRQPSNMEMNILRRFLFNRERALKNKQKRNRRRHITGPYISPSTQLQNPRPPLWKRDRPNGSGFFASVHPFERWRQEQEQLRMQKEQQQQVAMRDGTCGALVPYVGVTSVPTTNPFANNPFEKCAPQQASSGLNGVRNGEVQLGSVFYTGFGA